MNQQDFRQLLNSTPRQSTSSSATPKTKFGQQQKRGHTEEGEYKKPSTELFKPREKGKGSNKFGKRKEKEDDESDSAYRDRAKERRVGKPNDYAGVEKLLEDFQARSEGVEDKSLLEEQMKYLGGDADHSVLVKGLDFALLEREKQKLNAVSDQTMEEVEAELDNKLREEMKERKAKGKGRSRDEILKELKERRGGAGGGEEKEEERKESKFKPIGFKPIGGNKDDSKKKKKKKKELPSSSSSTSTSATATPLPSTSTSQPPSKPAEPSLPLPTPQAQPILDSDGEIDIFGDVGEYEGLGDSSSDDSDDEDKEKKKSKPPPPPPTTSAPPPPSASTSKRKYFDDDEEDSGIGGSTAPSSVTNLQNTIRDSQAREGESGGGDEGEGDEGEGTSMRLQPLGSSGFSARELLEMDKEAEKEELRKAKKLKYQQKAGEKREKMMSEEDKANRDYQVMENYLAKKEKGGKGGGGGEE